jgi:hypothetical protein
MRLTSVILVCLISLLLVGCASVILRPIAKTDLVPMAAGQAYTPEKDGWFLSDAYVKEIGVAIQR